MDADKMRGQVGKSELDLFNGPCPIVYWDHLLELNNITSCYPLNGTFRFNDVCSKCYSEFPTLMIQQDQIGQIGLT